LVVTFPFDLDAHPAPDSRQPQRMIVTRVLSLVNMARCDAYMAVPGSDAYDKAGWPVISPNKDKDGLFFERCMTAHTSGHDSGYHYRLQYAPHRGRGSDLLYLADLHAESDLKTWKLRGVTEGQLNMVIRYTARRGRPVPNDCVITLPYRYQADGGVNMQATTCPPQQKKGQYYVEYKLLQIKDRAAPSTKNMIIETLPSLSPLPTQRCRLVEIVKCKHVARSYMVVFLEPMTPLQAFSTCLSVL
jgi:hypothetical protein